MYNEAQYIAECIDSILAQTHQNWECTIVNNCSTDGSAEIAHRYASLDSRIRVYDNPEFVRAVANYNGGLRQISPSSKYCKIVFADDWIFPECLERMVCVGEQHPSVGIVGAYGLQSAEVMWTGLVYPSTFVPGREVCRRLLLDGIYVFGAATALLYRSDLVRSHDPFFNESNLHSDMEACMALLRESDFGFVHQILTYTREERSGSLRELSSHLSTYQAGHLRNLVTYGRYFLSDQEFEVCLDRKLSAYYAVLAGGLLRRQGRDYWNYHKSKLSELGHRFSALRLSGVVLAKLIDSALNPKSSLEHGWQVLRESRQIRRRQVGTEASQS
jgi:glycosyltransferase involved in cell wall biosynthesis